MNESEPLKSAFAGEGHDRTQKHTDLDFEGGPEEKPAIEAALTQLQKKHPRVLESFTIDVWPEDD